MLAGVGGVRSLSIRERLALAGVTALAALLLLPNLGAQILWQDEAQTAVIARTIASHGVPLGRDDRHSFSQELGREFGESAVWRWHTWLSFYAVAGSFALLGEGTAAARLPFALFGVATVSLAWLVGRRLWGDPRAATAGALLLALCVPFLILSRQCRYYAVAAFFSLLGLLFYARLGTGRRAGLGLVAAATLLFHTQAVYAGTLLAGLLVHAALCDRARLAPALRVTGLVALLNLPWIVWLSGVRPGGEGYVGSVLDVGKALRFSFEYLRLLLTEVLPAWLLLGLPLLAVLRRRSGEPPIDRSPATWRPVALLAITCAVGVLALALLSPLLFFRYLAPLLAPLMLLGGALLAALARRSGLLAAAALAAFVATGDLRGYLYELTHDFAGPVEGIVAFLRENGRDGDVVAISYGDMPLKFYTDLRVIGALTGEDPESARAADWIVIRRHANTEADARMKRTLERIVAAGGWRRHEIDAPDTQFENREDPALHRFRSASPRAPRVAVWERER
jgi:4-amino-4-deoxy-L-arabinose transferase-like glycosyltransferase